MKVFLDTNVFLRAILGDDKEKAKDCLNLLSKVDEGEIDAVTSMLVLNEILWVLEGYGVGREDIVDRIDSIIMSRIEISEAVNGSIALESLRYYEELEVDFADALNSCIAREIKAEKVVTYDEHFKKIGFIKVIEPQEL
jgi:predicted nucleic acid-binding protein